MTNTEFFKKPRSLKVNLTKKWEPSDTEEQYLKAKKKFDICYGPNDIEYKYNNYGFRCDNFESYKKHPHRILFAGCSMTEGIGLPLDDTWAKLMHNKISEDLKIEFPFWSIAAGGTGLDQLTRYLYHYGDLLRPQIILSNLPDIERRELWDMEESYYDRKHKVLLEEKFVTYQTEKNLAMINLLLEKWNTSFMFVTYNPKFSISHMNLSHMTQFEMFYIDRTEWDFARDGMHAGPNVNRLFYERFYNIVKPYIKKKLKC